MRRLKPTILVVDDDENDRLFIEQAFAKIGVGPVATLESGEQAVAYLSGTGKYADREAFPYADFVLTDLKMPNGDGFSILEHLKRNPEWAVIPTVVLTGSHDNDDIKKAYWLGASAYHVKPSSTAALRTLIKALHEYWLMCEVPELDRTGRQRPTDGSHKIGQRFGPLPTGAAPILPGLPLKEGAGP